MNFGKFLYGAAYYYEYLPYERLEKDIKMMKAAHINLVRIGESTWSTYEPQEGIFDFNKLIKVIKSMNKANIKVIVGTPTYAIPTWMSKKYPEVMLTDQTGKRKYGARQLIDITNPTFLFFAERIIKKIITITSVFDNVIGYQADNETKHFNTSSSNIYIAFQKYLKEKYNGNIEQLNYDYGLDYWSNRINSWEDFPPINSTINGSLGASFEKFQRNLVTNYLKWQTNIIKDYKKDNQFITSNFDFDWRHNSYGLNPYANHFKISKNFDIVAVDIYHPSQDNLDGVEISLFGDIARSIKNNNYIVMETQSQGFKEWVPYPGQLRLQAYSHIASGASVISYWPWASIHNGYETYWKGLLGHDFQKNPIYDESVKIGSELNNYGNLFLETKKNNKVAIIVSNQSLTAIDWFPYRKINDSLKKHGDHQYNDVLRSYYDSLYRLNIEVDILPIDDKRIFN
ncbi:beta-galactosidase, partial [Bombilactobacillus bombi]|uniref:beta-galactosidase n=1 Tax=Bombilactobacillus bombi TaxID=1303590 RepID=UPI0015E5F9D0